MKPKLINNYEVSAQCPGCDGALSLFCMNGPAGSSRGELGYTEVAGEFWSASHRYRRKLWRLLRCSGCGRAGIAEILDEGSGPNVLCSFHPRALTHSTIPKDAPDKIVKEFREAELCLSVEACRGASALARSALEKTLKENGYTQGTLQKKIDDAAGDGVITDSRKRKAHDDIRVLGNEVVHDEWREISEDDVESSLHYVQRILEDFYDDRDSVVEILIKQNRIEAPTAETAADGE